MSEQLDTIPGLAAAEFVRRVMQDEAPSDRAALVRALLHWCVTLLDDCDSEARRSIGHLMLRTAVWLCPDESFNASRFRLVHDAMNLFDAARLDVLKQ